MKQIAPALLIGSFELSPPSRLTLPAGPEPSKEAAWRRLEFKHAAGGPR